jgi:hypothetical protein
MDNLKSRGTAATNNNFDVAGMKLLYAGSFPVALVNKEYEEEIVNRCNAYRPLLKFIAKTSNNSPTANNEAGELLLQIVGRDKLKELVIEEMKVLDRQDLIDRLGLSGDKNDPQFTNELREALDDPTELISWAVHFRIFE